MSEKSIPALMRDLVEHMGNLVQDEIRLAKAELQQKLDSVKAAGGLLAGALAFAIGGIVILMFAAAAALGQFMEPWLASLIVGVAALIIAFVLLAMAQSHLKPRNLAPNRTADSVRTNAQFLKEKVQ